MVHVCLGAIMAVTAAQSPARAQQSWETFATARLTRAEIRQVIAAVEASAFDTPDSWETELRLQRINLGTSSGLVLRGTSLLCGGTGNCQIFVVRQLAGRWVSLFPPGQTPIVETFRFDVHQNKGIKDLIVRTNAGTAAAPEIRYRFDGRVYRQQ